MLDERVDTELSFSTKYIEIMLCFHRKVNKIPNSREPIHLQYSTASASAAKPPAIYIYYFRNVFPWIRAVGGKIGTKSIICENKIIRDPSSRTSASMLPELR